MRVGMLAAVVVAYGILGGCGEDQPCDRYVNYICDCHADDPGFDCNEISQALSEAGQDAQDQCAIDLADLQDEDDANGVDCSTQ